MDDEPPLSPPGLQPVTIDDKPVFDDAFGRLRDPISDYTFASTFMWSGALRLFWATIERHVCVFANSTGDLTMLIPPITQGGASDADLARCLSGCFEIMDAYNEQVADRSRSRIEYVSDEMLEQINAATPLTLSATPIWSDYVYSTERMIDLAGGAYKSKRHGRSKFINSFPDHRTEPLEARHVGACLALLDTWATHADQTHEGEVTEEDTATATLRARDRGATARALESHEALGLTGMTLWVGDRLVGFTLGERLGADQACVLVEKTDPEFTGAPQFIFSEFCRQFWSERPLVNVGDDWGIPGLRYTKQSYRPVRLMSKYVLTAAPAVLPLEDTLVSLPSRNPPHMIADAPAHAAEPTAGFTIRRGAPTDVDALFEIERAAFSVDKTSFTKRQIRALLTNPRAIALVAADAQDRPIGWAVGLTRRHVHPRSRASTKSARLYTVAVDEVSRGRGVGRALAERAIEEFRAIGARRAFLEVRTTNTPAITLYEKLGFTPRQALKDYYGEGKDGVRMALPLVEAPTPMPA
ncbi:MAG: GNAT family N-acetyltransferase [Phycisphaerales bacterium]